MTASQCYTQASLTAASADQAKFTRWAHASRQAAQKLAVAETSLQSARSLAMRPVTMQGPGASQVRQGAQDALTIVCDVGRGLGDVEHGLNSIADQYEDLALAAKAKVKEIGKYLEEHTVVAPHAEARALP